TARERHPRSPPPTRRSPSAWPWWRLPPGPAGPGRSSPDLRAQGTDGGPPDLPGGDGQRLPVAAGADPDALEDHHRVVVGDDPVDAHVLQQLLCAVAAGIAIVGVQPALTLAGGARLALVEEVAPGAIAPGALVPGPGRVPGNTPLGAPCVLSAEFGGARLVHPVERLACAHASMVTHLP